jgi:hypothetical protein
MNYIKKSAAPMQRGDQNQRTYAVPCAKHQSELLISNSLCIPKLAIFHKNYLWAVFLYSVDSWESVLACPIKADSGL